MSIFNYDVPDWYTGVYRDKASPVKMARPYMMVHAEKPSAAVLLIHGYQGNPGEQALVARRMYEAGFDSYVPRLPGMGTSYKDFNAVRAEDWIGTVLNATRDLQGKYSRVYIYGHSMGGSLAEIAAGECKVKKLALFAPALDVPSVNKSRLFIRLIAPFKVSLKRDWHHQPEFEYFHESGPEDDIYLGGEYYNKFCSHGLRELDRVTKKALQTLPSVIADTLSVSAGEDALVSEKASVMATTLNKSQHNKHVHIEKSTHYIPFDKYPEARDEAIRLAVEWFKEGK